MSQLRCDQQTISRMAGQFGARGPPRPARSLPDGPSPSCRVGWPFGRAPASMTVTFYKKSVEVQRLEETIDIFQLRLIIQVSAEEKAPEKLTPF